MYIRKLAEIFTYVQTDRGVWNNTQRCRNNHACKGRPAERRSIHISREGDTQRQALTERHVNAHSHTHTEQGKKYMHREMRNTHVETCVHMWRSIYAEINMHGKRDTHTQICMDSHLCPETQTWKVTCMQEHTHSRTTAEK